MLNRVIKVYKGTPTARDCKAALDPRQQQPCRSFSIDVPLVVARPEEHKPAGAPASASDRGSGHARAATGRAGPGGPGLAGQPVRGGRVAARRSPTECRRGPARPSIRGVLPQGFQANLEAGTHESGWPLVIVGDRDGAPMVLVPGGTFTMGNNEVSRPKHPSIQVRLATYYIDQHEVTNRQFRLFLDELTHRGQPAGKMVDRREGRARVREHCRSSMSTFTTPRRLRPGPANKSPPRHNGKWRHGRPTAACFPGATNPPNGTVPARTTRSTRS